MAKALNCLPCRAGDITGATGARRPEISVIVCTFNRATRLALALRALARVSVPDGLAWELIIVDNNSTDETARIVREFAALSGLRVRYLFETRQGLSFARNTGIASAEGRIIALTDDDVLVEPNWIASIHQAFAEHEVACVGGK